MIKDKIIVPRGIRYISEWKDFNFSRFPDKCIINKQLPGCGFTEYCINGSENVILCSLFRSKIVFLNNTNNMID